MHGDWGLGIDESLKFASKLPIYNSDKLGAILNSTNFYYHFLNENKKAIDFAKSTIKKFEIEAEKLDKEDDDVIDAKNICETMKANLEISEKSKI